MKICAWVLCFVLCFCNQNLGTQLVVAELEKERINSEPENELLLGKHEEQGNAEKSKDKVEPAMTASVRSCTDGQSDTSDNLSHAPVKRRKHGHVDKDDKKPKRKRSTTSSAREVLMPLAPNDKRKSSSPTEDQEKSQSATEGRDSSQPGISEVFQLPKQVVASVFSPSNFSGAILNKVSTPEDGSLAATSKSLPETLTVASIKLHEPKLLVATNDAAVEAALANESSSYSESFTSATAVPDLFPVTPVAAEEEEAAVKEGDSDTETPDAGSPAALEPFNQWAEKRRAEQENNKGMSGQTTTTTQGKSQSNPKLRQKNYALAECGAKVVGTNTEAQSASHVLTNYHDEYMLNPCTAKIWLVMELCEPIQASKIELANFELFSSSPRAFSVFCSDRYPTRDWIPLGKFEAKDEKTLQSFALEPPVENKHFFYKYIKVEMASHYGSEHFCPLSLIRVYGTSELELLTDESDSGSGENTDNEEGLADDEFLDGPGSPPHNLISSAKDAVISIVKKAAEALSRDKQMPGGDGSNLTAANPSDQSGSADLLPGITTNQCMTLLRPCQGWDNSWNANDTVLQFLSCNYQSLLKLTRSPTVSQILKTCSCSYAEGNLISKYMVYETKDVCRYLLTLVGRTKFSALCQLYRLTDTRIELENDYLNCTLTSRSPFENTAQPATGVDVIQATFDIRSSEIAESKGGGNDSSSVNVMATPKPTLEPIILVSDGEAASTQQQTPLTSPVSEMHHDPIEPTKTFKDSDSGLDNTPVDSKGENVDSLHQQSQEVQKSDSDEGDESGVSKRPSVDTGVSQPAISDGAVQIQGSMAPEIQKQSSQDASIPPDTSSASAEASVDVVVDSKVDPGSDASCGGEFPLNGDSVLTDMSELGMIPSAHTTTTTTTSASGGATTLGSNRTSGPGVQKESVFVRLSNRIKALEVNMSLSGQYLEELSQRYRKQMEEMQRAFNKTIGALNDTAKIAHERDLKQQEMITVLQVQIDNLSKAVLSLKDEHDMSTFQIIERHFFLILVELFIAACVFVMFRRRAGVYDPTVVLSAADLPPYGAMVDKGLSDATLLPKRRNSFTTIRHPSPNRKTKRRPSEEALNISGTYEDLLIVEPVIPIMMDQPILKVGEPKKKKPKTKKISRELVRSASNATISSTNVRHGNGPVKKLSTTKMTSAGLIFGGRSNEVKKEEPQAVGLPPVPCRIENLGPRNSTAVGNNKPGQTNSKRPHATAPNGQLATVQTLKSLVPEKKTSNGSLCNGNIHSVTELKKEGFSLRKLVQKLYVTNR